MTEQKTVLATRHYLDRAKERAGLNEKKAEKILQTVIIRGTTANECKWSSDRKFMMNRESDNARAYAYNGMCYILNENLDVCITVVELPRDFGKKKSGYAHKKMSDPKYLRRQKLNF